MKSIVRTPILLLLICTATLNLSVAQHSNLIPQYLTTNGLVAWYPFNGNANDESGNGNHGTVVGAPVLTNDRMGNPSSAYNFSTGINKIMLNDLEVNLTPNGRNTVNMWVNWSGSYYRNDDTGAFPFFWGHGIGGIYLVGEQYWFDPSIQYRLGLNAAAAEGETWGVSNPSGFPGSWVMITAIFNNGDLTEGELYINGVNVSEDLVRCCHSTSLISSASVSPSIGGLSLTEDDRYVFLGSIDDVGIWNRALTEEEIQRLYLAPINSQSITFNSLDVKTYGNVSFELMATASSGLPVTYISSNTDVATVAGSTVTIVGAGSTEITASQAGNSEYTPATPVTQTLTVNKANLIVTADAKSKYCGQSNPELTGHAEGLQPADNILISYYSEANEDSGEGEYEIIPSLEDPDNRLINYDVTLNRNKLTITGISIDASASSIPVASGQSITLSATVFPLASGIKVVFSIDDIQQPAVYTNETGKATLNIGLMSVGVYKVGSVAGSTCAESVVYLPVYDPSGGFVTGGGWINSPAGAYTADATLTGKATFGFVAKYKKGSSQVEGNTEFQFQTGNLSFKSTIQDAGTLVTAGSKAIYKGQGTINGLSGYSYMVSSIDGDVIGVKNADKFRIKIWNTANSNVVYDNQAGDKDNADATTLLGGGSIVIQYSKNGKRDGEDIAQSETKLSPLISVYPNPATDRLNLYLKDGNENKIIDLKIISMDGRKIQPLIESINNDVLIINVSELKSGVYMLSIIDGNSNAVIRFVKQ